MPLQKLKVHPKFVLRVSSNLPMENTAGLLILDNAKSKVSDFYRRISVMKSKLLLFIKELKK